MSRETEIQLELLKGDCTRLLDWVDSNKYPQSHDARWVATNIKAALMRVHISPDLDAGVRRHILKDLGHE